MLQEIPDYIRGRGGRWYAQTALIVAVALQAGLHASAGYEPLFPGLTYPVGSDPSSVVVGDVNRDDVPDLLVANKLSDTVSVFLGNGDGTFSHHPFYRVVTVGSRPNTLAVADLNGDEILDIVTANGGTIPAATNISVLLGNADGTFAPQQVFPTGSGPADLVIGDLNTNGIPDVVTINGDGTMSVLIGTGDGSFGAPDTFSAGLGPAGVAMGDLNGDGRPDLAVCNFTSGNVVVFLGNGDGTFESHIALDSLFPPVDIALDHLNEDDHLDLVIVQHSVGTVRVALGLGNGSFQTPTPYPAGDNPTRIVIDDMNGDGARDIVLSGGTTGQQDAAPGVSVLLGRGDGSFEPVQRYLVGTNPGGLAVADFDGDGTPDVAVTTRVADTLTVQLGNGDGSFPQRADHAVGATAVASATADLDGNGTLDFVLADSYSGNNVISVLLGQGGGVFTQGESFPAGDYVSHIALGDLNGDEIPDLVLANSGHLLAPGNSVSVLLGDGTGAFTNETVLTVGEGPGMVVIADVNTNGIPDLVVANAGTVFAPGNTVSVLLGVGDGSFEPAQTFNVGAQPGAIAVGDLNGDEVPDLVLPDATFFPGAVRVLLGLGDGMFGPAETFTANTRPSSITIADLNGDQVPDLAVTGFPDINNRNVFVLRGLGGGTFAPGQGYVTDHPAAFSSAGDFDGDGILDLTVMHEQSATVSVLRNLGDGTFGPRQAFAVRSDPQSLVTGDFNGDGSLDIATATFTDGGFVSILINPGSPTPQEPVVRSVRIVGNDVEITIEGEGGTAYVLQASIDLTAFSDIGDPAPVPGTGRSTVTLTEAGGANHPLRFYRITEAALPDN